MVPSGCKAALRDIRHDVSDLVDPGWTIEPVGAVKLVLNCVN